MALSPASFILGIIAFARWMMSAGIAGSGAFTLGLAGSGPVFVLVVLVSIAGGWIVGLGGSFLLSRKISATTSTSAPPATMMGTGLPLLGPAPPPDRPPPEGRARPR